MKTYAFKIKKNTLTLSVESKNSKMIADEFAKFAEIFIKDKSNVSIETNIDLTEIIDKASEQEEIQKVPVVEVEEPVAETQTEEDFIEETVTPSTKVPAFPANFAKVLAAKSEEKLHVVEKRTSELQKAYAQMQDLIKEKSLSDEIDYIVAAAFCLSHYENILRFNEAQIKAKIAPFFEREFEHNFVLDAVARNFIKVLPDFTGFSDTIEFELTEQGEEYFLNEL